LLLGKGKVFYLQLSCKQTGKPLLFPDWLLCAWRDSNPHAFRHQILSLARLPITPHAQIFFFQAESLSATPAQRDCSRCCLNQTTGSRTITPHAQIFFFQAESLSATPAQRDCSRCCLNQTTGSRTITPHAQIFFLQAESLSATPAQRDCSRCCLNQTTGSRTITPHAQIFFLQAEYLSATPAQRDCSRCCLNQTTAHGQLLRSFITGKKQRLVHKCLFLIS
jgi:hypothetical protein